MPIKMFCKDANAIVTVYKFDIPSNMTLIYKPLACRETKQQWLETSKNF